MINRVVLVGRLTCDPDLRTTGSGTSIATFTLAVDRQYANAQGKRGADFISCVIWRKAVESFCNFTNKGSLIDIDGRIQTRSYDNRDGRRVYVTEVIVGNFSLLESRKDREARSQNGGYTPQNNGSSYTGNSNQNTNFQANNSAPNTNNTVPQGPLVDPSSTIDISDDNLPF